MYSVYLLFLCNSLIMPYYVLLYMQCVPGPPAGHAQRAVKESNLYDLLGAGLANTDTLN